MQQKDSFKTKKSAKIRRISTKKKLPGKDHTLPIPPDSDDTSYNSVHVTTVNGNFTAYPPLLTVSTQESYYPLNVSNH